MNTKLVLLLLAAGIYLVSGSNPCNPGWTGFLPHETNCTLFYICNQGYPNVLRCPENLHFNLEREACLYQEEAQCDPEGTRPPVPSTQAPPKTTTPAPEDITTTTEGAPGITTNAPPDTTTTTTARTTTTTQGPGENDPNCPAGVEFIYVSHPGDCNKFILCRNGANSGTHNCGSGLWFNFDYQICTPPWGSSCRSSFVL